MVSGDIPPMTFITVNGVQADTVSALDRGLAYGDGVFETCRLQNAEIALWSYHAQRLTQSLSRLSLVCELSLVESFIKQTIEQAPTDLTLAGVLKVMVTRGVGDRGYGFSDLATPTVICSLSAAPVSNESPVRLPLLKTRLGCSSALAGMKHLNRLENVLLKAECQRLAVDDGLAVNELGFIIETTHSNVFLKFPDGWKTPKLNVSGVKGVMRQLVLERLMPDNGVSVCEADITLPQLTDVASGFSCNSLRGLTAIKAIGDQELRIDNDFDCLVKSLQSEQYKTL